MPKVYTVSIIINRLLLVYTIGINVYNISKVYAVSMEKENMGIVKVDGFKCERCGHLWISDKFTAKNPPIACAKCKSPYWNIPKKKGSQM